MWKVLHINDYPVGGMGGAEVIVERTVRMLRQEGVAADIFTSADLPDARLTPKRYLHNSGACRALAGKLETFQPDIIHLHNFYHVLSPAILGELAQYRRGRRVRVVMTAHDYHLVCPNSGLSWFRPGSPTYHTADPNRLSSLAYIWTRRWDPRGLGYSALKCAQHFWHYRWHQRQNVLNTVICPSKFATNLLRQTGLPTVWLPHPSPVIQATSKEKKSAQRLRFVYAGRLVPEKGLAEMLSLWPNDLDAEWTIIGEGPEKERYLHILRKKGLDKRTRFLGHLSHSQTMAEISSSHVLVLPSRWPETYGLTLIEALAAGTNILISNQGAIQEMAAAAKVGYVFNLDEPVSLHRNLRDIQESFRAGTLNDFDIAGFLEERSEKKYLQRLMQIYAGEKRVAAQAA